MTHRIASHLGLLLLFASACAAAPAQETAPPAGAAAPEVAPSQPEPASTPAAAESGEQTARLRHPGEPRKRSDGVIRPTAALAASKPTAGGPPSPCADRAPGERWAQPGGGTCACRPDGQVTCRSVETTQRFADEQ